MNEENPKLTNEAVALDLFGRLLMEQVRDPAIVAAEKLALGEFKGFGSKDFALLLPEFSDAQREAIRALARDVVEYTLHTFLFFLEEDFPVDISVTTERDVVPSLRDVSDGLAGEMYGKGWISRFSKYPLEESGPAAGEDDHER